MTTAFNDVVVHLDDADFQSALLLGDERARRRIDIPLSMIATCSAAFPVAAHPNAETREISSEVAHACRLLESGAKLFSSGVTQNNAALIRRAIAKWVAGTTSMQKAAMQLATLTSS